MSLRSTSRVAAVLFSLVAAFHLGGCSSKDVSYSDVETQPTRDFDFDRLASTLDAFVGESSGQVKGYSFALDIGGSTVFERAGGDLSTSSTIPIASSSKAPAAVAILSLVDDGLIDLDTPIGAYLGTAIRWPLAKSLITMRMLLNHTSGIPFATPCLSDQETTLQACTQEIADTALDFAPGTRFGYSGAGFQVAGFVAQQVTGKSWATLLGERVTAPLGMSSYSVGNSQNPRVPGGATSKASDYLKLMRMMLNGGTTGRATVLSRTQAERAKISQITGLPIFYSPIPANAGIRAYSFGWWISDLAQIGVSAGPEISAPGLLGATPWLDYDQDYCAAILIESDTETGVAIWNAVRPLIVEQIAAHPG